MRVRVCVSPSNRLVHRTRPDRNLAGHEDLGLLLKVGQPLHDPGDAEQR
ncbi:MAG TPA: hypothetical protein VHU91_00120 [Mycobacteriales bacterium]|nr:hypothetical protein [Mycobacteriales bacterium]